MNLHNMATEHFQRYIGIDYSGAETPSSSLKGLRVYMATSADDATEVPPPPSPRRYWTRKEVAHWLLEKLSEPIPTIVGIDHGFSFPLRYFETYQIPPDWDTFLRDFTITGRPTSPTCTWTLSAMVLSAMVPLAQAVPNGAARQSCVARVNRFFISTAKAPSPSPPTPVFPGCCS